jgi:hypothetical protein
VLGDDAVAEFGGGGEEVGRDEAGAVGDLGLEDVELFVDVGACEEEGEGFEGGVVGGRDIEEGEGRVEELVEQEGGGFGWRVEERILDFGVRSSGRRRPGTLVLGVVLGWRWTNRGGHDR